MKRRDKWMRRRERRRAEKWLRLQRQAAERQRLREQSGLIATEEAP
jgi:hypothetical protein